MTCLGGLSQVGVWGSAGVCRRAGGSPAVAAALSFPSSSRGASRPGASRGRRRLPGSAVLPAQPPGRWLAPPLCGCSPPRPLPLCPADSLLAVIYGRTWHRAHRLENFQFTQEFPEK